LDSEWSFVSYRPIEEKMMNEFGPFVANTHTETTVTGTAMTKAYYEARRIIKRHVNANSNEAHRFHFTYGTPFESDFLVRNHCRC